MITRDNMIPLLSYHGTCDPLVPYYIGPYHYCSQIAPRIHNDIWQTGNPGKANGHEWF